MKRRSRRDAPSGLRSRVDLAFARIDRHLSEAEQIIGSELSSTEVKEDAPRAYRAADQAYAEIERARRRISRRV